MQSNQPEPETKKPCYLSSKCKGYQVESSICNDDEVAEHCCGDYNQPTRTIIVTYPCHKRPKPKNYKKGWYTICDMDFLTRDAIIKHCHISRKTFDKLIATTRKGGANEGKVGTDTKVNQHNGKKFTVYDLYGVQELLKKFKA